MREELQVKGMPAPTGHYCDAVRFGDLLFTAGVPPVDENNNVVGGDDIVAQTRQVLVNLEKILKSANAGFEDILKITIYMTDPTEISKLAALRKEFFRDAKPASTLIGTTRFAIGALKIEIEAVVGLRRKS